MTKTKIGVAMSGGVDSAVSAALLIKQGYDVIGIFMKNWSDPIDEKGYCRWIDDQLNARQVAEKLNIPFYTFNFEKEYKERVLDYFLKEYRLGRTPNPDVMCNKEIKFDLFLNKAKELDVELIATGHYARVQKIDEKYHLYRGVDDNKDQSYFLWTLGQEQLRHCIFPVGDLKKPEVRKIALELDLQNAKRKDSQGICFIGPVEVYNFLKKYIPSKKGFIKNTSGKIIGEHDGIYYYTIGQRKGLDLGKLSGIKRAPMYIKKIDCHNNEIIVAPHDELFFDQITALDCMWVNDAVNVGDTVDLQVRYRQNPVVGTVVSLQRNKISVKLKEQIWAVTSGQSLVVYRGDELLGGGIIE